VDVLGDAEDVESVSELDEKRYGVIVSKGLRRGLLLPNLEGVNSPLQQIDIALQKGGISKSETYKIQRFEVVRHT
ncbi:MAG: AMMECR1 domain-containing protein, partial [Youngiibacter sp.]|nr:AMMECR1 domain-containing protein [Youngiibacter sp.]